MINHGRTLLLNRASGHQSFAELGEEYIPAQFVGLNLAPWMQRLYALLYGSAPDRAYMNFQAERLLRFVHAAEYETYLFQLDPRITYDPFTSAFADVTYGFVVLGSLAKFQDLAPITPLLANESLGVMQPSYSIVLLNGAVSVTNLRTGHSTTVAKAGGETSVVLTLPDTDVQVRFSMTSSNAADWNGSLQLTATLPPTRDVATLVDNIAKLSDVVGHLFELPLTEPYTTFAKLWSSNTLPDRIVGATLAYIYRLHDLLSAG